MSVRKVSGEPDKTAVLFYNGIGNFVMATPFFQNLPSPSIFLMHDDPRAEAIRSISLWPTRLVKSPREIEPAFSTVYILWAFPRSVAYPWMFAQRIARLTGARRRVVRQSTPAWRRGLHETDSYYALLDDFKENPTRIRTAEPLRGADVFERAPLVGLCNGSAQRQKQWPLDRWADLARRFLDESAMRVVYFGSDVEAAQGARIGRGLGERFINLAGECSLAQSAWIAARCDLVVANDTAMMHVADAVGTPVVALWGPTLWSKCRPVNGNAIPVMGLCDDAPCYGTDVMTRCTSARCMESISVDQAWDAAMDVLRKRNRWPLEKRTAHERT